MTATGQSPLRESAIIAEYSSIRTEILQLNDQAFKSLMGSIALDITVLSWMFSREDPSQYFSMPAIGVFILFAGVLVLLNRNRLAHRLAIFQKIFIEPRIPDICWARVYFQYREEHAKKHSGWFSSWGERIAESGGNTILIIQIVNLLVFLYYGIIPWFQFVLTEIDYRRVICFLGIICIIAFQRGVQRKLTDYSCIHEAMIETYRKSDFFQGRETSGGT